MKLCNDKLTSELLETFKSKIDLNFLSTETLGLSLSAITEKQSALEAVRDFLDYCDKNNPNLFVANFNKLFYHLEEDYEENSAS